MDVIDEAGASAQLNQAKLPEDIIEVQKPIRFIVQRMENSIANHEFEKARCYGEEERKERQNLAELRKIHKLDEGGMLTVGRKEIENAVSKLTGLPVSEVRASRPANDSLD